MVTFKLDTGAEVIAISHTTYQQLPDAPPLSTPSKVLCGPARKPLQVLGQCEIDLSYRERSIKQQLFMVAELKSNLLGLPAIQALNLAARFDETADITPLTAPSIHKQFPKVFQRLGNLGEEYEIKLKPDATLFLLFMPHRAQLAGAKLFSKLDANSGSWQIPLSPASRLLTTFITPSGRYCFNKLPFGISSVPEHFQKQMSKILTGLDGVVCQMDDVLVFGSDRTQHDARLLVMVQRIESAGVTLNAQKSLFF